MKHPKSNGLVERFVGNVKQHLKVTEGKGDLETRLQSFLLQYRCAGVHAGKPPSERIFAFKPQLPMLLANPRDPILYERFQGDTSTFVPGVVISNSGSTCINVHDEVRDSVHTRHAEQVKTVIPDPPSYPVPALIEPPLEMVPENPMVAGIPAMEVSDVREAPWNDVAVPELVTDSARPRRDRRPPSWLQGYEQ